MNAQTFHGHSCQNRNSTAERQGPGTQRQHTLDVPWHMHSHPTLLLQSLLFMQCQFISGSRSPVIKITLPRVSNQISNSISCFTEPEIKNSEQTLCISFHRIPKTVRPVILKRQPSLCVQDSQFNTKHFYSSADN